MANPEPILWRNEYSVGVADIDAQHQRLLELLNKVNAMNPEGLAPMARTGEVMKLLESFNEYAAYHFLSEEALMREHIEANEDTVKHIVAHRSYWSIISTFKKRFQEGDEKVNGELVEYLNRWWINHILETDQQLGRELNRRGVR
ncbi:MAG: bacteriohemerythrin [Proteobacteria bacterium]|nr:bacteriohemerythrin [Pseudomonadota bacterium]